MNVECKKCGYGWETKSELIMVSCPSCGNKVKIKQRFPTSLKEFPLSDGKTNRSKQEADY